MWIAKAYGREFVAQTEVECWELLEEFERGVTLDEWDAYARPVKVEECS